MDTIFLTCERWKFEDNFYKKMDFRHFAEIEDWENSNGLNYVKENIIY